VAADSYLHSSAMIGACGQFWQTCIRKEKVFEDELVLVYAPPVRCYCPKQQSCSGYRGVGSSAEAMHVACSSQSFTCPCHMIWHRFWSVEALSEGVCLP